MDVTIANNKAIKLKAIDQLVEGQEFATKLQTLISQPGSSLSGLGQVEDLVARVLGSIKNTISVLDLFEPVSSSSLVAVEGSQNASCDENGGKFEDSGDSRKRAAPTKGKRGCYKRKKKSETTTTKKPMYEDEFSWRKYGQKEILNTKFPRNYFRCTHKYTQGCMATKQVQKLELEPKMFNITYIGKHTCNTNEVTPKIVPCDQHDEIIIDSEEFKSPSLTISMKKEEETHNHGSSNANDLSLVWPEVVFEEDHHHHHHHEAMYGCGETSASDFNVMDSSNFMVFGVGNNFTFSENEQFSYFDACSGLL